ncbi:unnamed protein product [Wickerhamomyces anomalus]
MLPNNDNDDLYDYFGGLTNVLVLIGASLHTDLYSWDPTNIKDSAKNSTSNTSLDRLGSSQAQPSIPPSKNLGSLDNVDQDLGSIISSISAASLNNNNNSNNMSINNFDQPTDLLEGRRNSIGYGGSGPGSDVDSDFGNAFGFKRGTLSLGTYNINNTNNNNGANGSRLQPNGFGSASISGGVPSHHMNTGGSGRFLEKFAAVAEATREVELLGGGLGSLSIGSTSARVPSSRRTSFLTPEGANPNKPFHESSPNSINESLNNPLNPSSTRQSISERIDNYLSNSNSPNQAFKTGMADHSRSMSMSSDLNNQSEHNSLNFDPNEKVNTNIWNTASAASATTFTPMTNQPSQSNQGPIPPQGYPQMFPYGFPFNQPFPVMPMVPPQFMGSQGMFGQLPPQQPPNEAVPNSQDAQTDSSKSPEMNDENSRTTGDESKPATPQGPPGFPLHPKPTQPNFNGGNPPFMYPQAFSPYGFLPPQLAPQDPSQFDPQNHQQQQAPPPPMTNNHPKRRSPKPSSPNNNHHNNNHSGSGNGRTNGNGKGSKNHIYRSPLLEEFRNNPNKNYTLKDIFGSGIEFSKDQHGSRFIQQQLSLSSFEEKEVIFNEIREVALDLMTDVFGNYVIQKYFEHGSDVQKQVLLEQMKTKIHFLSLQMYGCRVVQRAIEYVPLDDQVSIVVELKDSILACIKDQNGNHVIQKAIEKIPIDKIEFILDSLRAQIYHLSTHPYGCRVIQRLLEYSKAEDQEFILGELSKYTYFLIQDQYGNYVIQHIIEHGKPEEKKAIVDTVTGSVVEFSKHKFASNVVEKSVMFGNEAQRAIILDEVLKNNEEDNDEPVDDRSPLGLMMKDQFANYVVQKLVDVSKGQKKKVLIKKIKQFLKQISKSNYGKHLASIEKLIVLSETAVTSDDEE